MKVGIDTFGLEHGKSGLGAYLLNLINYLPDDGDIEFEIFGFEEDRYTYSSKKNFNYVGVDVPDTLPAMKKWHVHWANAFFRKNGYDAVIFCAASKLIPSKCACRSIAIVNCLLSKTLFCVNVSPVRQFQIKTGLKNADAIVVPSMFVKKDLNKCKIRNKNIHVIHNGIDHGEFFAVEQLILQSYEDIKPFAIKKPYIIYASRLQNSEKHHVELIRAFTLFKDKTHLPHRLVLAGAEGFYVKKIMNEAYQSKYASEIIITDYFPHESYPGLYRNSDCAVFPAVNEGVGMPVLEAMASGIPVACSKSGSLPEIAGQNALFFDSDNVQDIADSLEKIISDRDLRAELVKNGLDWASRFDWKKTTEQILALLKK